jgi:hypothetical protein
MQSLSRGEADVSKDVAQELRRRCDLQLRNAPSSIQEYVERHESRNRQQLTLRLVQTRSIHLNIVIQSGAGPKESSLFPGRFPLFWTN